jgi:hypothetical protein
LQPCLPHSHCGDSIRTPLLRPHPPSLALPSFGRHLPSRLLLASLPPSPRLPSRLFHPLPSRPSTTRRSARGAGGGTDDAQILTLAFSRNRMRNWFSHACPIPLPTMARRVRCGIGAHIDAQFLSRHRRRAKMRIWGSHLRPGPRIPGSHKAVRGADKRTPASRNPPAGLQPVRQPPAAAPGL